MAAPGLLAGMIGAGKAAKKKKTSIIDVFGAAGKGRENMQAGLQAAAGNRAQPLAGILGAHKNVATKGGVKRVKRKP